MKQQSRTLPNGIDIPSTGFGTFEIVDGLDTINAVKNAIKSGYRLIDTAHGYHNETGTGIAVEECIKGGFVSREDLFIVTKSPHSEAGYNITLRIFEQSLKKLRLEYVDLLLTHSPFRNRWDWQDALLDTWSAFEKLYKEGKVKSIGVCNCNIRHLEFLMKNAEIKPMVCQIEIHPEHQNTEIVEYCKNNNIIVQAWGSLNRGKIFHNKIINNISLKYNKTPAQIAIRWSLQKELIPLAKSIHPLRIAQNYNIFDFEIKPEDMELIDSLDGGEWSNEHTDKPVPLKPAICEYEPYVYKRDYKLFGFIPFLCEKKFKWNKTKWYFLGIPFLKAVKRDFNYYLRNNYKGD